MEFQLKQYPKKESFFCRNSYIEFAGITLAVEGNGSHWTEKETKKCVKCQDQMEHQMLLNQGFGGMGYILNTLLAHDSKVSLKNLRRLWLEP